MSKEESIEKMEKDRKIRDARIDVVCNYNVLVNKTIGVDGNGDETYQTTEFGIFCMGADLPTWLQHRDSEKDVEGRKQVADYLRKWADALTGE